MLFGNQYVDARSNHEQTGLSYALAGQYPAFPAGQIDASESETLRDGVKNELSSQA